MDGEKWVRRIREADLGLFAVPLLEVVRALGFVIAHVLLLGQPLLAGLVSETTFRETTEWLEDPRRVGEWIERLRETEET